MTVPSDLLLLLKLAKVYVLFAVNEIDLGVK